MFIRFFLQILAVLLLVQSAQPFAVAAESPCIDKRIIGQESWVHIEELKLDYLARVDTGATSTSLHATDFMIIDGSEDHRDNVGKIVNFLTVSTDGEYKRLEAEIAKVQTVLSAQGREKRYMVWLTMTANGVTKRILTNLRDRSQMHYKLLVGRDWLAKDFLVDVDMKERVFVVEGEEE